MTIASFEVVFYTAIFLLPGFIIKTIIDTLNPPKRERDATLFLSYLAYSLVNLALCSWAYMLANPLADNECNLPIYWLVLLGITIVGTVFTSIIIGFLKHRRILHELAKKLKFNVIDPTPTAWDYWFHKADLSFVVVTLKDGKQIHGFYGVNSFASSDQQERDLFLEKVYAELADGSMITTYENNGIYISKDMIKQIEFIKPGGNQECQTKTEEIETPSDTMGTHQD